MMTSSEMDAASPCTVILLGQPTLRHKIRNGQLASLDQRISVRYHLGGMAETETPAYLRHHLQIAGRGTPLVTDDSVALIHQVSRGYPRTINNICRQALLAGWAHPQNPHRGKHHPHRHQRGHHARRLTTPA
jgi:type II secretory pathway predicted ATPase ExeA